MEVNFFFSDGTKKVVDVPKEFSRFTGRHHFPKRWVVPVYVQDGEDPTKVHKLEAILQLEHYIEGGAKVEYYKEVE